MKLRAGGKQETPHNNICKSCSLFLGSGVVGVSKPSPCHDKPQSSPVPKLGWAGALHNMPQPGLPCLARITMWSQNTAVSVLAEGPEATHPWSKDFSWILKTQGWTPTYSQ